MSEACLQLDVGNSGAKWRLVTVAGVLERGTYRRDDEASRDVLLALEPFPTRIWISSVAAATVEDELTHLLRGRWGVEPWFARTAARSGELVNSYAEPSRMGVDRWLAMLGARARHHGRLCVVDAGSALTVDLVADNGAHEGGYIIPGPALMERALLLDTDRVRFDEDIGYSLDPGRSTAEAVRHGIALAQAGAVKLALASAGAPQPALFFCGGAGQTLQALAEVGGTWVPDLVFEGLEVMAAYDAR